MENRNDGNMDINVNGAVPETPGKNRLKIIIPVTVVAVLLLVLVGIAALAGMFGSKKRLLINAVGNVFSQSTDAMKEVWGLEEYRDMFADGKLSMEADFSVGNGVQFTMDMSRDEEVSGASIDVGYYGSSILQADLYTDQKEILVGVPALTDTVFYVDRESLEEDIEWFAREYDLDSELVDALKSYNEESRKEAKTYEELGRAMGRLTGAFSEICDEIKVEKAGSKNFRVDGQERSCKGYTLAVSGEQIQRFIDVVSEVYEENEAFQLYLNGMLAVGYGYGSQEEFLEDYDTREILSDMKDRILEEQAVITFYVYRENLAYLQADLWDGIGVEWNVYGGNFPLENTEITLIDGYGISVYSREGSRENGVYKAEYKTEHDGDEVEISLEYDMEKGDFELEMSAGYGLYTLTYFLEGEIDKVAPGSELVLSIDTFEMNEMELLAGDITFSNEVGEIIKPEGDRRNILRMTQSDWYKVLMEISGNLY